MNKDFTEAMSNRADEELIKIVTIQRADYQPEAVSAAEKELELRQVSSAKIETVKEDLTMKEEKQKAIDTSVVSSGTRIVHFFVDFVAFFITALILSLISGLFITTNDQTVLKLVSYVLFFISFFTYFVVMEFKFQKTIGKFLTKTKVVMIDGQRPRLNDIISRTLYRLIPIDQISFIFTKNGFHDSFSKTTVIKEKTNANN